MNKEIIPQHIAIIPDGNRRWAREKGLPSLAGHKKGFERTLDIILHAKDTEVKVLTFYAFSTENWNRTKDEVDYLMKMFGIFFDKYTEKFHKLGIRLRHLGNFENINEESIAKIMQGVELTKANKGLTVQLALNYGGRDELKRAIKKIVEEKVPAEEITEKIISDHMDTSGVSDPDLIIRTSGEHRLSGFLLWQSEYSEFLFSDKLWPDFTKKDFDKAILEFQNRQRRFGG